MSNTEVGALWLAEKISVVSPSSTSKIDVSTLDASPRAVAVDKTGLSIEGLTLL